MPDIAMCKGGKCPKKKECYRYNAKPNELYQSYFLDPPLNKDLSCDHFWKDDLVRQNKKSVIKKRKVK